MSTLEAQMTHALWDAADAMDWDEMDKWEVREPTMPDDEEAKEEEMADAMEHDNENKQANENRETLDGIVREMRNLGKLDEESTDKIRRTLMGLGLRTYADRIEAAMRRERKELVDAVREATDGMCLHCDMQQACAEGEDGMPTTCNAMARVRNFIETYGTHDEGNNDECPF